MPIRVHALNSIKRLSRREATFAILFPVLALLIPWVTNVVLHDRYGMPPICNIVLAMAYLGVVAIYARVLRGAPDIATLACLAATVGAVFVAQQQPQDYTYDLNPHMNTITYYCDPSHSDLQPFSHSSESHQPPLYYLLAGYLCRLTVVLGNPSMAKLSLGSMNYFFFCLYQLYGILIIQRAIRSRVLSWLGVMTLLAWPANLLHEFRIGNDALLYLAFTGGAYHFLRWYHGDGAQQFSKSLMWVAAGIATKNSIWLLPVIWALLLIKKYAAGKNPLLWIGQACTPLRTLPLKELRWAILLCVLAAALGIGRNAYTAITDGRTSIFEGKYGTAMKFVPNPGVLVEFDPASYMAYPYTYHEDGRDDWFWNMYLRTMSFGEYRWDGNLQAYTLNVLLAAIWLYFMVMTAYTLARRAPSGELASCAIHVACMVGATMLIRMSFEGYVPWADARHMYFVVVFLITGYLCILDNAPSLRRPVYAAGAALLGAYMFVSLVHIDMQVTYAGQLPILKEWMVKPVPQPNRPEAAPHQKTAP